MEQISLLISAFLLVTLVTISAHPIQQLRHKRENGNATVPAITTESDALAYLTKYGYNPCDNEDVSNNTREGTISCMLSSESLLKDFQNRYGLPITGKLDSETKQLMSSPRCGMKDKPHAFKLRQPWSKKTFKWRLNNKNIPTFGLASARDQVRQSFSDWAKYAPLTFEEALPNEAADFDLGFVYASEDKQFDGPGGTLAYAYFPPVGQLRFEAAEQWTNQYNGQGFNFRLVATHELGHALGLDHSYEKSAVMYAYYRLIQPNYLLPADDRAGIQALYDKMNPSTTTRRTTFTFKPRTKTSTFGTRIKPSGFETATYQPGRPHGNPKGGRPFDDAVDMKLSLMTPCIGVELFSDSDYLFGARFIYAGVDPSTPKIYRGEPLGRDPPLTKELFMMQNGERINKVIWYVGTHLWQVNDELMPFVLGIQFHTTSGRTSRLYGSNKGEMYSESYDGFTFAYAKGRSVVLIDQLQIMWKNQEMIKVDVGTRFNTICEDSKTLVILSAIYQCKPNSCSESKDVTKVVRQLCGTEKSCSFLVNEKVLNINLSSKGLKELLITHTCSTHQNIFGPILANNDWYGNDISINGNIRITDVNTILKCGEQCLAESRCVGVVYYSYNKFCYLKHTLVLGTPQLRAASMAVVNRDRYV